MCLLACDFALVPVLSFENCVVSFSREMWGGEGMGLSHNVTLPGLFVLSCTRQSDPFVRNSLLWQSMSEQSGNSFLVVMATYSLGSS